MDLRLRERVAVARQQFLVFSLRVGGVKRRSNDITPRDQRSSDVTGNVYLYIEGKAMSRHTHRLCWVQTQLLA